MHGRFCLECCLLSQQGRYTDIYKYTCMSMLALKKWFRIDSDAHTCSYIYLLFTVQKSSPYYLPPLLAVLPALPKSATTPSYKAQGGSN